MLTLPEVPVPPPIPPPGRILREGSAEFCGTCGSSIKRAWFGFGRVLGCLQPLCWNYKGWKLLPAGTNRSTHLYGAPDKPPAPPEPKTEIGDGLNLDGNYYAHRLFLDRWSKTVAEAMSLPGRIEANPPELASPMPAPQTQKYDDCGLPIPSLILPLPPVKSPATVIRGKISRVSIRRAGKVSVVTVYDLEDGDRARQLTPGTVVESRVDG